MAIINNRPTAEQAFVISSCKDSENTRFNIALDKTYQTILDASNKGYHSCFYNPHNHLANEVHMRILNELKSAGYRCYSKSNNTGRIHVLPEYSISWDMNIS